MALSPLLETVNQCNAFVLKKATRFFCTTAILSCSMKDVILPSARHSVMGRAAEKVEEYFALTA